MEAFVYFLLWIAAAMLALRLGIGRSASHRRSDRGAGSPATDRGSHASLRWIPPETDTDPVCGRTVHPERAKPSLYDGYVYYFCSGECRERFETAPTDYLKPAIGDRVSRTGGQR